MLLLFYYLNDSTSIICMEFLDTYVFMLSLSSFFPYPLLIVVVVLFAYCTILF